MEFYFEDSPARGLAGLRRARPGALAALTLVALCLGRESAQAYEFEASARTIGQAYSLSGFGEQQPLSRRRITQSLQLHLWDIGGQRTGLSQYEPRPTTGPTLYFTSYLRLDQDFGSYLAGQILVDGRLRDAVDLIPELARDSLQIDMLFGYFGAEGLLGGRFDLYAGRQMEVQTLDWFSMDGLKVRAHLPGTLALEAFGGLRVREGSPLGSAAMAPDGTSGALCEEYVEGAMPGSGAWRPIDGLPARPGGPFTSDDERCPQREEWMPTFGAALATTSKTLIVRLAYRRSQSQRPGVLGAVDRLDFPDRGYYPNEGQAPGKWGVNEERLSAALRSLRRLKGGTQIVPYLAARYSLLHGLVDEAHGGLRLRHKSHALETELFYSVPTFDGDSIFNVFSTEPYTDLRSSYHLAPKGGALSGYVRLWGRRFHSEDREEAEDPLQVASNRYAAGGHLGVGHRQSARQRTRLDSFFEDGYGGRRYGSYLSSSVRVSKRTTLRARLMAVRFDEDLRSELRGTNLGTQLGTTYVINRGVAASLLLEHNSSRLDRSRFAGFAVIDLAFQPET